MKLKSILNKKFMLTLFFWITILCVLQNPTLAPLNIFISSTQLTASAPTTNGLSLQGSFLVNQASSMVQATNSTSGELVNAYQTSLFAVNFMSIMILAAPWAVYIYTRQKPTQKPKAKKKNMRKTEITAETTCKPAK